MEHSFQYHTQNNYARRIMINEHSAKKYCCEDISLIENYDKAVADKTQTWQCHHRAEILPCGRFSRSDLVQHGLLFHRPANELVFLTQFEHKSIHKNHLGHKHSNETKLRMSLSKRGKTSNRKGAHHTEEARRKISLALSGRHLSEEHKSKLKSKVWANNGVISKMFNPDSVPTGWSLGRISWKVSE